MVVFDLVYFGVVWDDSVKMLIVMGVIFGVKMDSNLSGKMIILLVNFVNELILWVC